MSRHAKSRNRLGSLLMYLVLIAWTAFTVFPLYWTVITSVKTPLAVNEGPFYFPFIDFKPTLDAWVGIFTREFSGDMVTRPFGNSVVVGLTSAVLAVILGSLAAYGLTRFTYRLGKIGNKDIAFWILSQRMLPPIATVIPLFIVFKTLRILDTRISLILAYTMFNLPFSVWLMRDFFASLPREVEECALVDGCTPFQVFYRIALPLSTPGLVATFIFCLIFAWNEFLFALVLTFSKGQTMPLLIAGQNFQRGPQWWDISAMALLTIFPVLLLALLVERYIVRGLTLGAVKE
ncbi:MAG TPA: carbohydrate ABC transporter permease [Firmicutes bacterium]|nr:carbohydrate ABC transporter permease [Bacillota bacterium]